MSFADDGILTVAGETPCAEVEERAHPWLFAADRPDLTVREWIDRYSVRDGHSFPIFLERMSAYAPLVDSALAAV